MITTLSILIPTFNRDCTNLVHTLKMQADAIPGLHYEVLVADDASTQSEVKAANRNIRQWDGCQLVELESNIGRARIRNFLAQQAQYPYLLFLDSDVQLVRPNYIQQYLQHDCDPVVYGGVCIQPNEELARHNLRYRYELECEPRFSVEQRRVSPYQGFRTSNFLVKRDLLLAHPFDERIRHYGYEDVLFGRRLLSAGIPVTHVENPVAVDDFEPNDVFLRKTDEGLRTLQSMSAEMSEYTHILVWVEKLRKLHLSGIVLFLYRIAQGAIKRNLLGQSPNVKLYNIYRLCTYLALK